MDAMDKATGLIKELERVAEVLRKEALSLSTSMYQLHHLYPYQMKKS